MASKAAWAKAIVGGLALCIGGPMLVNYVSPTEEELFKRYNPDLQRRSLEGRDERLREANEFISKLKEYSKSDKPIWTVIKEEEAKEKQRKLDAGAQVQQERQSIAAELRKERLKGNEQ